MGCERENQSVEDLPSGDPSIERGNERNREDIEQVPEPGTDPLHEGP
jgi:hypothetical protein